MKAWWGGVAAGCLLVGCGDGDGPKSVVAPLADIVGDSAAPADVAPDLQAAADISQVLPDVASDVGAAADAPVFSDVAIPSGGACPSVGRERSDVVFKGVPRTFPAPTLIGNIGAATNPDGDWKLVELTFFQVGTFVDWVTVAFTNAGDTHGAATFGAADMFAVEINLDMNVAVTVGENAGSDRASSMIGLGGPIVFDNGWLRGDLDRCGSGVGDGRAYPQAIGFDHDGSKLRLAVIVSREDLITLLPEDQRANAEYVVTGPLTVVARFER